MTMQTNPMPPPGGTSEPDELGYGAWIAFWAQLIVLGALVVFGASFASADSEPGDYACGLILVFASLALAFLRIKQRFDGGPPDWSSFLLVDDMMSLLAVVAVFAILALAGLFVAAGFSVGGLHNAGIALFVTSGIGAFLSLKHVFDAVERGRRG
jgi:small-conductance mechanosensitive channel